MYDDIDWMNASADCGLIALCREMEAMAAPLKAAATLVKRPKRPGKRMIVSPRPGAAAPLNA